MEAFKGKERKPASNCWVAAQLDTVVSAPDVTTAKRAPECSRCQFSSMQHKPFQLRICFGLLKLVLLQQNVCTGSMRTSEALEESPLLDLSNKRFRQKVMKTTQRVIRAFKYSYIIRKLFPRYSTRAKLAHRVWFKACTLYCEEPL